MQYNRGLALGDWAMSIYPDNLKIITKERYRFDPVPLWVLAAICTVFLVVKAVTTGLWYDEALFLLPIKVIVSDETWKTAIHARINPPTWWHLYSKEITIGPVILLPGLLVTWLVGSIQPPILHLLVLAQVGVAAWFLRNKLACALLMICLTATPAVFPTQFLGEFSAAIWLFAGLVLLSDGRFFAAGVCLSFGPLSKFLGWLPMVGVLSGIFLTRPWRQSLRTGFGAVIPLAVWEAYQIFSLGGWTQYLELRLEFVTWVLVVLQRDGAPKPFANMLQDIFVWFQLGGVGAWAAALLAVGAVPSIGRKLVRRKELGFFELAWFAYAPGWIWWVIFSQWINHHALMRHGSIFAGLGLLTLLHETKRLEQWELTHVSYLVARGSCYALCGLCVVVLGWQSYLYIWEYKGYGRYTSWAEQRGLAQWIDTYGPVRVLNCDSYLQNGRLEGDIDSPQMVLSSGNYTISACGMDSSAQAVVVLGSLMPTNMPVTYVLTERAGPHQTLWVSK